MLRSLIKTVTPFAKETTLFTVASTNLQQQLRTTFVLKRLHAPRLSKKGFPQKGLRSKNYIYEFVKDTNVELKPDIEVIITSFVEGIGNVGDKVSLRPQFAYNNLLLPGLAVYATPENIEKYKHVDVVVKKQFSSARVPLIMTCFSNRIFSIVMNKDTSWTLQPWHVRASLRKCGYVVPEHAITLPEKEIKGPNLEIQGKVFSVTITINKTEKMKVNCRIHHWSTNIQERLPYEDEFWKKPPEYLFPEDAEDAINKQVS